MKLYIAEKSGFCFGIDNAIKIALDSKKKIQGPLYSLDQLLHNNQMVEYLSKEGIQVINSLDEILDNSTVLISSHGVGKDIYDLTCEKKLEVVDATCPYVKKVHEIVSKNCSDDTTLIIIGDKSHPEIIGVKGWCPNNSVVVNSLEEVEAINECDNVLVVAQTTLKIETFNTILGAIKNKFKTVKYYNTICSATIERQDAAYKLSKFVDYMIIIGGKQSSNTKKLYEICLVNCKNTVHIETKDELIMKEIKKYDNIGISAGASTPDWVINEVIDKLIDEGEGILMQNDSVNNETMDQFDTSFNVPRTGKIIKGNIIMIAEKELIVNIGYKSDAIIPLEEIPDIDNQKLSEKFSVDQEIEAVIIKTNDGVGNVLLSIKKMSSKKDNKELETAFKEKTPINVIVKEVVNGGLIALYKDIKGFIPASQLDVKFVSDLNSYVGKSLEVEVIKYDTRKNKIILSRKNLLRKQYKLDMDKVWKNIEENEVIKGVVRRFTDFGAFVDVGGVDGLLHLSEISWGKVNKANEKLTKNQEIDVKILNFDRSKNKISLSIKQLTTNPWESIDEKYTVDEEYTGTVVSLTNFGAFVELEEGLEGLIHVSQLSEDRIEKASDILKIGQEVKFRILEISKDEKKIKLTMKQKKIKE